MGAARTIDPPAFVTVGATVAVVDADDEGPTRLRIGQVEKITAQHFTVTGIETPGEKPRPVRFQSRGVGMVPLIDADAVCPATGEGSRPTVVIENTDEVAILRAAIVRRRTVARVHATYDAWRRVERRATSRTDFDNRPAEGELDAALVAMADAVVALRALDGNVAPVA